jgi:hypothetical protein
MAAANWPHLLARVLVVPGTMAMVEMRGWVCGAEHEANYATRHDPDPTSWGGWAL